MLDVEEEIVLGIERSCEGEMLYLCPDFKPLYFCDMCAMRVALPANATMLFRTQPGWSECMKSNK